MRIDRLRQEYDISVQWVAFPLHPETPQEGMTLEELFAGRPVNIEEMKSRMRQVASDLGLPIGDRTKTYNSRLAQELGKWAESKKRGDVFHEGVFRAYFVDGVNIGLVSELVDLAQAVGLPEGEARTVLEERTYRHAVDEDWNRSLNMGIRAVPTFVAQGRALVGAQPYEELERFLLACNASKMPRSSS